MAENNPTTSNADWRPRAVLLALFALFLFPILGAMVLNVMAPSWLPFGRVNHGELLQPPVRLEAEVLALTDRRASLSSAKGTWLLVHVSGATCEARCEQALASMRQSRLALGKDADRVERWWFTTGDIDATTAQWLEKTFPGVRQATVPASAALEKTAAQVRIVDPSGYVILRYVEDDPASKVHKDFKRLLKISKQG